MITCPKCGKQHEGKYQDTTGGKKFWCFGCHQDHNYLLNPMYALIRRKLGDQAVRPIGAKSASVSDKYYEKMLIDGLPMPEWKAKFKAAFVFTNPEIRSIVTAAVDPFTVLLPPKKRRAPTGRGGYDRRSPNSPNAGEQNENALGVWALQHVPEGQEYVVYARKNMKSLGHDAAYVDAVTKEVQTPLEYKSSPHFELTAKEAKTAREYFTTGREYWIVTPKGKIGYDPQDFEPTGAERYVGW